MNESTEQVNTYIFQLLHFRQGSKPTSLTVPSNSEEEAWEIAYSAIDDEGGEVILIDVV